MKSIERLKRYQERDWQMIMRCIGFGFGEQVAMHRCRCRRAGQSTRLSQLEYSNWLRFCLRSALLWLGVNRQTLLGSKTNSPTRICTCGQERKANLKQTKTQIKRLLIRQLSEQLLNFESWCSSVIFSLLAKKPELFRLDWRLSILVCPLKFSDWMRDLQIQCQCESPDCSSGLKSVRGSPRYQCVGKLLSRWPLSARLISD